MILSMSKQVSLPKISSILQKIKSAQNAFSSFLHESLHLTFIFHLSPEVSKKIHIFLILSKKPRCLVAYIGKENKTIELQMLA